MKIFIHQHNCSCYFQKILTFQYIDMYRTSLISSTVSTLLSYIGHQYCKPRLKELCQYSEDVSECWTYLALQLDLSSEIIKTLDIDYTRTKDKCFHMFDKWLERYPDPCWCEIVEALRMVKMSHLATDIEAKHLGM